MNCANHADASAVAYCRTCGKALCANCTRPVRGVIYCEDCLGARMEGGVPASGFVAGTPGAIPPAGAVPPYVAPPLAPQPGASGPNPTVAGILAGVFPFGVGAVYTGQYAKGLAHLAIFGLLIAGCNVSGSDILPVICGFGIAFFVVYQIIDAVRSARALQAGLAPPDPYGLAATFGGAVGAGRPGAPRTDASKFPVAAIVLILLGILFLLHTAGLFEHGFDRFWPLLLIFLGAWMFARNFGLVGSAEVVDPATCRRRLMGPAMVFTIGVLFLLENLDVAGFHRTWPIILLVAGGVRLIQGNSGSGGNYPNAGPGTPGVVGFAPPPVPPPAPPADEVKSSEVNHG